MYALVPSGPDQSPGVGQVDGVVYYEVRAQELEMRKDEDDGNRGP